MSKLGVWIIGARGNVATTMIVGARALARDLTNTTGMVTGYDLCNRLELTSVDDLVFGGHDIRETSLETQAWQLADSGIGSASIVDAVSDDLARIDERIKLGTAKNCGRAVTELAAERFGDSLSVCAVVDHLRDDYQSFKAAHDLDRLVVANLASTEPPMETPARYESQTAVERAIDADDADLPASVLYAYAALVDGHPYVNVTSSTGSSLGGLDALARERGVPHAGNNIKTGETLVETALGPMFDKRNLRVRSWVGHNILGNDEGEVEGGSKKTQRQETRGTVLQSILDYSFHNSVRTDHTPSLEEWKTAWDHIHFEGFLNTEMKMKFTWEGADSALAAPLVLDLVRLIDHADRHGESGRQLQLASFFTSPMGVSEHGFSQQFDLLRAYVDRHTHGRKN
jgi:myo-inositol-1-phosphate synthase